MLDLDCIKSARDVETCANIEEDDELYISVVAQPKQKGGCTVDDNGKEHYCDEIVNGNYDDSNYCTDPSVVYVCSKLRKNIMFIFTSTADTKDHGLPTHIDKNRAVWYESTVAELPHVIKDCNSDSDNVYTPIMICNHCGLVLSNIFDFLCHVTSVYDDKLYMLQFADNVSLNGLHAVKNPLPKNGYDRDDLVISKDGVTYLPNGVIVYPTGQVDDSGFVGIPESSRGIRS